MARVTVIATISAPQKLPQISGAYQSQEEDPATAGHRVIGLELTENSTLTISTHNIGEEREIQNKGNFFQILHQLIKVIG